MGFLRKRGLCLLLVLVLLSGLLTGCSDMQETALLNLSPEERSVVSSSLHYRSSLAFDYAERVAIDRYEEGDALITVGDDRQYLLVPEGNNAPKDLKEGVSVLQQPLQRGYLAGTASMDYFVACNALKTLSFSSLKESAWKVTEAAEAMREGDIRYAGKYSTPDYELLTTGKCGFAVENTMLYHSPAVLEELESLGIPVFIDLSSREASPEARMEWVKVYGLLTGHWKEAVKAFSVQEKEFQKLKQTPKPAAAPKVAFFSVHTNGTVSVRLGTDYIPAMIEMAGGEYLFSDLKGEEGSYRSTMNISMEEFYRRAKDADYLIFNSTIEGERTSVDQLLKDAPVLKDCKAVEVGNVFCTTEDLYQHTMAQGDFVRDLHEMLTGGTEFKYIFNLE